MDEREMMGVWVQTWKHAGTELEAIRRQEIRQADNLKVLASLEAAFIMPFSAKTPKGAHEGALPCSCPFKLGGAPASLAAQSCELL